jgi:hypothetical protein
VEGLSAVDPSVRLQCRQDLLVWSAGVGEPFRIELYDALGRHLATTEPRSGAVTLPAAGLAGRMVLWRARSVGDAVMGQGRAVVIR